MKDIADNNFKFNENDRNFFKLVENTKEKGEIARFPQCFQKTCTEQFLIFQSCFLNPDNYLLDPNNYLLNSDNYLLNPDNYLLNSDNYLLNFDNYLLNPDNYLLNPDNYLKIFPH